MSYNASKHLKWEFQNELMADYDAPPITVIFSIGGQFSLYRIEDKPNVEGSGDGAS